MNNKPPAYNPGFPAPDYAAGKPNVPSSHIYPNLGPSGMPMPMTMPVPSAGGVGPQYKLPQSNATVGPLPPGYPGAMLSGYPGAMPSHGYVPSAALPVGGVLPPGYPTGNHSSPKPVHHSPKPAHHYSGPPASSNPLGYPAGAVPVLASGGQVYAVPGHTVIVQHGFVFQATVDEVKRGKMEIQYSPSADKYYRPSASCTGTIQMHGWRAGVFSEQNMMHKLEHDHKKVYLARNPGSDCGRIEWRFESSGYKIKSIKVEFCGKTFHNGQIRAYLVTDCNQRFDFNPEKDKHNKFKNVHNARKFSIIAEICGGSGNDAWQHAQLFRQDCDEKDCAFQVAVKLDK